MMSRSQTALRELLRKVASENQCDVRSIFQDDTNIANIIGVTGSELDSEEAGRILNLAARVGLREVAKVLLAAGADVLVQDDESHYTPLLSALNYDHLDIAELILDSDRGGNEILDRRGDYPLHLAVRKKYVGIVKKLLFFNVNPHVRNGSYPLEVALGQQRYDIAKLILSAYAWRGITIDWGKLTARPDQRMYCLRQLDECHGEIQRMKETKLAEFTTISYYDLAKSRVSKVALCLEDEPIRRVLRQDNSLIFPNYGELLDSLLRRAEKKRILYANFLAGFVALSKFLPLLSKVSVDTVLLYLSEQDMRNFVGVFKFHY